MECCAGKYCQKEFIEESISAKLIVFPFGLTIFIYESLEAVGII